MTSSEPPSAVPTCPTCGGALSPRTGLCAPCFMAQAMGGISSSDGGELLPEIKENGISTTATPFGEYSLLEIIGRGGMGVVWRAEQKTLGREIALKLLPNAALSTAETMARFRAEAWAAARLDHPGIIPVYEIGEAKGQPFIAMKLAEGGSLSSRLKSGPMPAREAAQLIWHMAMAIQHAHERGVLHRDLKPANILFDARGEAMVADFGLARLIDDESDLTTSGTVMGSPGYLSPEQARGETATITVATDVWGLGALLYAALTGRPPFRGTTAIDTVRAVVDRDPERPTTLQQAIPRDLEIICLRALEKTPSRRYATAAAMAADLECWMTGRPISARAVGPLERTAKWLRRHPAWGGLAALLTTAGVILTTQSIRHAREMQGQRDAAVASGLAAQEARHKALDQAYAADVAASAAALEASLPARARRLLDAWATPPDGTDRRDFTWHWLHGKAAGDPATVIKPAAVEPASTVQLILPTQDGKQVFLVRGDGVGEFYELSDGRMRQQITMEKSSPLPPPVNDPERGLRMALGAASPDGRWLIWSDLRRRIVLRHDLQNGTTTHWPGSAVGLALVMNESGNDGKRLQQLQLLRRTGMSPSLVRHEWDGNQWQLIGTNQVGGMWDSFSEDGHRLVSTPPGRRNTIDVWDCKEMRHLKNIDVGSTLLALAMAPDGCSAAVAVQTNDGPCVQLIDLDQASPRHTWRGHMAPISAVFFSADGSMLCSVSTDFTACVYDVNSGRLLTTKHGHSDAVQTGAFLPDGSALITAARDGEVRLWPLQRANAEQVEVPQDSGFMVASGNGQWVAGFNGAPPFTESNSVSQQDPEFSLTHVRRIGSGKASRNLIPLKGHKPLAFCQRNGGEELVTVVPVDQKGGPGSCCLTWWRLDTTPPEPTHQAQLVIPSIAAERGCLSQNGNRLAIATADGLVAVFQARTGKRLASMGRKGSDPRLPNSRRPRQTSSIGFALSPDGSLLAVAGLQAEGVVVYDATTLLPVRTLAGVHALRCLAWSPDGQVLALGADKHRIHLWRLAEAGIFQTLSGHSGLVSRLRFSADGKTLASVAFDSSIKLWHAATGRELATITTQADPELLHFAQDNSCLLYRDGNGRLVEVRLTVR